MKQSGGEIGRIGPFADRTNDEVARVAPRPPRRSCVLGRRSSEDLVSRATLGEFFAMWSRRRFLW
jgi:hypothetical protein